MTAATTIAAAPESKAAAASPEIRRVSDVVVNLTAASSILNIPINLLIDIANVPANEVAAINYEAAALFYTGSWWVSDATNIWGTDPGDPPKYIGGAMMALPFPYLSVPLGTVLAAMAIAELPVHHTCNPIDCKPFAPFDFEGAFRVLVGLDAFPILNNFFTVPLSALFTGYYLDPTAPGQQSYVGPVPTNPFGDEYPLPGTVEDPNNPGHYLMPWAGQTINLNEYLAQSFNAYYEHLIADPATNPIKFPTLQDVSRAVTNLFAALVVEFSPFAPGMSWCPACEWPRGMTPEGIVEALSAADPGNTLLKGWLENHDWQVAPGPPATGVTSNQNVALAQSSELTADSAQLKQETDDQSQAGTQPLAETGSPKDAGQVLDTSNSGAVDIAATTKPAQTDVSSLRGALNQIDSNIADFTGALTGNDDGGTGTSTGGTDSTGTGSTGGTGSGSTDSGSTDSGSTDSTGAGSTESSGTGSTDRTGTGSTGGNGSGSTGSSGGTSSGSTGSGGSGSSGSGGSTH